MLDVGSERCMPYKDKTKEKAYNAFRYQRDKEKILARNKRYRDNNIDKERERNKRYRNKNTDKEIIRANKYYMNNRLDKWVSYLYKNCYKNNKRFGSDIDFDPNYILELYNKQNGLCAYFKIPLIISTENKHPLKPSIDRIDNNKGYTKDNIVLCCLMANMGRNSCNYDVWKECLDGLEIKKKCSM